MPTGVYTRTEAQYLGRGIAISKSWTPERRKRASERMNGNKRGLGHKLSGAHREALLKCITGNQWNKGKTLPEETKLKISLALKGRIPSNLVSLHTDKEILKRKGLSLVGNKNSVGFAPPNKGKLTSEEVKKKLSEAKKGDKNYNWQGGISSEKSIFSISREWRDLKKIVIKRDKCCLLCGEPYKYFTHDGHHIIPFGVVEERLNPLNIMLICKRCHSVVHSKQYKFIQDTFEAAVAKIKAS